jgi:predicted TPR repeat methyltransferase
LHFTEQELETTFHKAHTALTDHGVLAFSVKSGEGDEWTMEDLERPRYYNHWTLEALSQKLQSTGFEVFSISQNQEKIEVIAKLAK